MRIRDGRADDAEAVGRVVDGVYGLDEDYVADAFPRWVAEAGERSRVLVAEHEGDVVGVMAAVLLTPREGWVQGIRVSPRARGLGAGSAMTEEGFRWMAGRGAVVARNLVFSWNPMGLALSRHLGMQPVASLRWALVEADGDADAGIPSKEPEAAWRAWASSRHRALLGGLSLDANESWAVSELLPEDLERASRDGSLLVTGSTEDPTGTVVHVSSRTWETDEGEVREARCGAATWRDAGSCRALVAAVARDAAERGDQRARVLVPEDPRIVSDLALARTEAWRGSLYVLAKDLLHLGNATGSHRSQG